LGKLPDTKINKTGAYKVKPVSRSETGSVVGLIVTAITRHFKSGYRMKTYEIFSNLSTIPLNTSNPPCQNSGLRTSTPALFLLNI
jgi:hypothetical protein